MSKENKQSSSSNNREPGMRVVEKPKDFKNTSKKLLEYLSPYQWKLIIVVVFAMASAIFSIIAPKIVGNLITFIFQGVISKFSGNGGIDFDHIRNVILILLGLYIISAAFSYIQGFIVSGVAQDLSYKLRKNISKKINKLPLKYFDQTTYGNVLSRVTNDIDTVSQTLNQSMSQIITSITVILGVLVMMLSISWQMTLATILILPLSMVLMMFVVKKSQKYFKGQQKVLGLLNGHIEEIFSGHHIVKGFNAEEEVIEKFEDLNGQLYNSAWKSQFLSSMMMPLINFIGNLGYVAVSILGAWFTVGGIIQVGDIVAFIQYMKSFTNPIAQVAQMGNVLQSTMAAAERVFEFLEEKEEVVEHTNPVKLEKVRGEVEFDHVQFGYSDDKIIIHDFSSTIKAGQKVAIVGPTGAGKTTIVKLLMRYYDLNCGQIKLDGHNINDFTRADLRSNISMVLQDTWLFSGTIMENIRYGRRDASDEEVIAAAKAAHADSFIRALPKGYQMEINEEADNISQGQKQLLTIARAILSNSNIMILDEATSSVDTRTEILIQKAMENLMKNRTSFVIAHRLSTIKNADMILVMNDGDIVEQGDHQKLLEQNGFYAELYNSQFVQNEAEIA